MHLGNQRWCLLFLLLILSLGLSACSYSTDFVVVNDADYAIQVTYKVKESPTGPPTLGPELSVVAAAKLEPKGKSQWSKLDSARYSIDQVDRTVTVTLFPHEALLVTSMHHYIGDEDPNDVQNFQIQELSITGAAGEMKFTGDAARKAFKRVSRVLYTISYK